MYFRCEDSKLRDAALPDTMGRAGIFQSSDDSEVLAPTSPGRVAPEQGQGARKLSRLSKLQRWILHHAGEGMERSRIAEGYFGLQRRYVGWYTDPYMSRNVKKKYEARYRRRQPAITKSLLRLEDRGLVKLVRHGRCVKAVELTDVGRNLLAQIAENNGRARELSAAAGAPVTGAKCDDADDSGSA